MDRTPLGPRPLVYAHRGDRSRAADNTLEAFDLAVDAGADGIELDVRETGDGVLIMTHDPAIADHPPIASMRFDDLRRSEPRIPTLEETLRHVGEAVFLNVEVKHAPHEPGFDEDRLLVDRVIETIHDIDDPDRILLSSFDPVVVERARHIEPDLLTGLLITGTVAIEDGIARALDVGADALHPPMTSMAGRAGDVVELIHAAGLASVVWNANSDADIRAVAEAGVDLIITDHPGRARTIVDDH